MTMRKAWWAAALVLAGSIPAAAQEGAAKTDEIVARIEAVKMPRLDPSKREDEAHVQQYVQDYQKAQVEKAALIAELYKADPRHEKLKTLLPERWQALMGKDGDKVALAKELTDFIEGTDDASLKTEAGFFRMICELVTAEQDGKRLIAAVDKFIAFAPKDERGPMFLIRITEVPNDLTDADKKALLERVRKDFPDSRAAAKVESELKKAEAVGKPFELAFNEAITGKSISMADLKGKVVVIDFWATWCGPCVAEMPTMKKLYAEYKPKGVEFIGVSLDSPESEGGLDALKKFVADKKIEWPQYYQGNGWESEFSTKWGINAIPAVFVVDQQGNLFSLEARGKLEEMIPELLKKGAAAGE